MKGLGPASRLGGLEDERMDQASQGVGEAPTAMRGYGAAASFEENELQQLQSDRDRLEQQAKQCLAALNQKSLNTNEEDSASSKAYLAVHRLALESDTLRTENIELIQEIKQRKRLKSLVQDAALEVAPESSTNSTSVYAASKKSPWAPTSSRYEDAWRVKFQNDEPSFHFHPFTKAELTLEWELSTTTSLPGVHQFQSLGACLAGRCTMHRLLGDQQITLLSGMSVFEPVCAVRSTKLMLLFVRQSSMRGLF